MHPQVLRGTADVNARPLNCLWKVVATGGGSWGLWESRYCFYFQEKQEEAEVKPHLSLWKGLAISKHIKDKKVTGSSVDLWQKNHAWPASLPFTVRGRGAQGTIEDVLYSDFSKAFNTVSTNILAGKLVSMGCISRQWAGLKTGWTD